MNYLSVILIGIGLSMDAFAVSVANGMLSKKDTLKKEQSLASLKYPFIFGGFFGFFQFLMPVIGFFGASMISSALMAVGNFISFALLSLVGGKMLYEVFFEKEEEEVSLNISMKGLCLMSIATSLDALAVGVSFSLIPPAMNIFVATGLIGVVTFGISAAGFLIGAKVGGVLKKPAKILGGLILILIGIKILFF